jgi:hypothetical protein
MGSQITELENAIAHLSGKMLTAVGIIYGHDSDQYQMAGGKRRRRKTAVTPTALAASPMLMVSLDSKNGNGKNSKAIVR